MPHVLVTFRRAHVEVDATFNEPGAFDQLEQCTIIEPKGWTHPAYEAESFRVLEECIEADQRSQRGAHDAGRLSCMRDTELALNQRHDFIEEERQVGVAASDVALGI